MQTQEYIEQEIKWTDQESPTAPSAAPRLDETKYRSKVPRAPSACAIDFYQAGDQGAARSQERRKEPGINSKANGFTVRRLPSVQRVDHLEDSLYWLFSGATLVYILLDIIGH
jgi:hypothetical protein